MKKIKTYTDDFKLKIVKLIQAGKPVAKVAEEFDISPSNLYKWKGQYERSNSFLQADNMSPLEMENRRLKKELKQARMESDILKQAALIMGQKAQ